MLCKKCKTSVGERAKICSYCGAKIDNGKKSRNILAGIIILFAVSGSAYLFLRFTNRLTFENGTDVVFNIDVDSENTSTAIPFLQEELLDSITDPTETSTPDLSKEEVQLNNLLQKTEKAAVQYYEDFEAFMPLITNRGYLYHYGSKEFITVKILAEIDLLEPEYAEEQVKIFYLRPSDFYFAKEVSFSNSNELEIFTAYDTATGVSLYSRNNSGVVYRENLNLVLEKYEFKHGTLKRETAESEKYNAIVDAAESYEFSETGMNVHYLCADDKYAIAVMSERGTYDSLKAYVFEYREGLWIVALSNLEDESNLPYVINKKFPDLNLDLLPDFNIRDAVSKLIPESELMLFHEALIENEVILPEDSPNYMFGTNNCVYITLNSGRKMLFIYQKPDGWTFYEVGSWFEAEVHIMNLSLQSHTFVIKQEELAFPLSND